MIYVLLLGLVAITCAALLLNAGDYLSPEAIVCMSLLVCTVAATYSVDTWGVDLSSKTVYTLLYGVGVFVVAAQLGKSPFLSRRDISKGAQVVGATDTYQAAPEIAVSRLWLVLLVAFSLVTGYLYFSSIQASFASMGLSGNWNDMMLSYHVASTSQNLSEEYAIRGSILLMYKALTLFAYLFVYATISNSVLRGRVADTRFLVVPAIYALTSLLTGGRMPLLKFFFFAILIFWVLFHRMHGWRKVFRLRQIVTLVVAVGLVLVLFSGVRTLVGRTNTVDLLSYLAMYLGGSINLFDAFIREPLLPNTVFGYETFAQVYRFIGKLTGDATLVYPITREFRYAGGIVIGNVYTAFRSHLYDFGYSGLTVMTGLYGLLFSYAYSRVKRNRIPRTLDWGLFVYAWLAVNLFFFGIQDFVIPTTTAAITLVLAGPVGRFLFHSPSRPGV